IEDIEQEARMLANSGVKELILVAQDTTLYGQDLYPESARGGLAQLLRRLNRIKSIIWIRLLYTHPAHFTDDLIEMIAKLPRVAKYIDLPLQHISDRILKQMNRKVKRQDIERLLERLRKIEGLTLRTSFIVGFPSETDKDFSELLDFVRQSALGGFDHLGCFTYCREKGSPAYRLRNQVSEKVKIERFNEIMKLQKNISRKRLKNLIGKKVNVLIDTHLFPPPPVRGGQEGGYDYIGRTEENAPEIDGLVYLKGKNLNPGDYVTVKVIMTSDYDLFAVKD
ncbi:MAG: radical SAM protein, partial [candidate division WOR-3 bacterium]|nr:radical SAM protein [candidate division WOR-3 bacterium]